nr:hypothetical protein [uncultured bacterium]
MQYLYSSMAGRSHFAPLLVLKTHFRNTTFFEYIFFSLNMGSTLERSFRQILQGNNPLCNARRSST